MENHFGYILHTWVFGPLGLGIGEALCKMDIGSCTGILFWPLLRDFPQRASMSSGSTRNLDRSTGLKQSGDPHERRCGVSK